MKSTECVKHTFVLDYIVKKITCLLYNLKNNKSIFFRKNFRKTLEKSGKVHELYIDFPVESTYNSRSIADKSWDTEEDIDG